MVAAMLAAHLENLVFLLLLVVAGLFQLLGRIARNKQTDQSQPSSEPPPRTRKPIPRAEPQSDQERVRKFLEALGNPPAAPPPPQTAPRPTARKPAVFRRVPPMASPLPPLTTRPPDLPGQIEIHPETFPAHADQPRGTSPPPKPVSPLDEAAGTVELVPMTPVTATHAIATHAQTAVPPRLAFTATVLRSNWSLRDAIVVREILGPPRGLQDQGAMLQS